MNRAVTSASNIHRRFLCPGSEKLETGLPEEENELSKEGVLLHSYYSNPELDRSFLKSGQRDLLRTADIIDNQVFERVAEQFNVLSSEHYEETFEHEMWLHQPEDGSVLFPGHCDRRRGYPRLKLGIVIDQKFGWRIVEPAEANLQLRSYAVMAAQECGYDSVAVAISQPRLEYERRLTLAAYTKADINASVAQLEQIWVNAKDPKAPLRASEAACRYCRARTICPEFARVMAEGLALVPSTDGTVTKRQADLATALAQAADETLGRVLNAIQFAGFIDDATKDEARRRIAQDPEAAGRIGWKLGKESTKRKIVDPARAIALLQLRLGFSKDESLNCSSPSLTKIEEKVREKRQLTWKEAKDEIHNALGDVIIEEAKKQSLIRNSL